MIELINLAVAVLALLGGFLAARGFLPHVDLFGSRPSSHLARGLVIGAISTFPRLTVWDVVWQFDAGSEVLRAVGSAPVNLVFNLLLLVSIWEILKARWLALPEEDRDQVSIWRAAFYPGGELWPRLTRKDD